MHKAKAMKCPNHIKPFRESNRETIAIDSEIAKTMKHLWENGIITLGSCQGIEDVPGPNIVIHPQYNDKDIKLIRKLIKQVDKRTWIIFQWEQRLMGK